MSCTVLLTQSLSFDGHFRHVSCQTCFETLLPINLPGPLQKRCPVASALHLWCLMLGLSFGLWFTEEYMEKQVLHANATRQITGLGMDGIFAVFSCTFSFTCTNQDNLPGVQIVLVVQGLPGEAQLWCRSALFEMPPQK